MNEDQQRSGHLYGLLVRLLEQLDWERVCAERGWDPTPLSIHHEEIEKRARDEIAGTIQWWDHAAPERPHRLVGSKDPEIVSRRWAHRPDPLLPGATT